MLYAETHVRLRHLISQSGGDSREEGREREGAQCMLYVAQVLFFMRIHEPFWRSRAIVLPGRAPLLPSISFHLSLPVKLLRLRDHSLLREKGELQGLSELTFSWKNPGECSVQAIPGRAGNEWHTSSYNTALMI